MSKYTIGIDFGTLSGRAVIAEVANGRIMATATYAYPHGVMDRALPDGTPLPDDWALQHPQDYLDVLDHVLPEVMEASGIDKNDLEGICIDFTSATAMPVDAQGTPLCFKPEFEHDPHAYVKLWKHHAAQDKANIMTRAAMERGETWLKDYGGKVSSEFGFPKLWQVQAEAPHIYSAMDSWCEAGDWLNWVLTGRHVQNATMVGWKYFWNKHRGFPSEEYFAALDEGLRHVVKEKMHAPILPMEGCVGGVTAEMAARFGIREGMTVASSTIDAHVALPGAGNVEPGQMLMIIGTSTCHHALNAAYKQVAGICGAVEDGAIPGLWDYEAGQNAVGDLFAWFVDSCVPPDYHRQAEAKGISIHQHLTELADALRPGESGLIALDWWNGNRSVLTDVDLTGMILGMTLQTRPEEIYRALIEATAFATRVICDCYQGQGVELKQIRATGGISLKNPMLMQIYADVLNMPIHVVATPQGGAQGAAIIAAAAAGCYGGVTEAAAHMASQVQRVYKPKAENAQVYDQLYQEYVTLHDYFGREGNQVMKRLKALRAKQSR